MIQELVAQWEQNKEKLRESFVRVAPSSYDDIFTRLFLEVLTDKKYETTQITTIDNGDHQGTRIFIIPEDTYQPCENDYLVCGVSYGSCSGCDTFEGIISDGSYGEKLTEGQLNDLMTLALHMVQSLKPLA